MAVRVGRLRGGVKAAADAAIAMRIAAGLSISKMMRARKRVFAKARQLHHRFWLNVQLCSASSSCGFRATDRALLWEAD